jgi:Fe-S-cluster containining protein
MAKFWHQGLQFSCQQCGNCCTHSGGGVYTSENEFRAIADHLNISMDEFLSLYTDVDEGYVTLKSKASGPCIFYKDGCTVYNVRPTQCRTYPFWPENLKSDFRWNEESKNCAGMNSGRPWTKEEIKSELQKNQMKLMKK